MLLQDQVPPELVRLLGALAAPAWVGVLGSVAIATGHLVLKIKQSTNGNGHAGTAGTWQVNITAAVSSLAAAVSQLGQKDENILRELAEIRRTVERSEITSNAKLDAMPCREDVAEIAEKNRAVMREQFQLINAKLDTAAMREATQ